MNRKPKTIKLTSGDFSDAESTAAELMHKSRMHDGPVAVHCSTLKDLRRLAVGVREAFETLSDEGDSLKIAFEKDGAKVVGFTAVGIQGPTDYHEGGPEYEIRAKLVKPD
jgi:hypothetical protein